eukprot:TRINITY_DN20678_c0_g1_i1.p1 TRINITY_DN20678_c0_g1~~TRINITY_DN20678_c0_g1_i1.p1  ORF type:complete len:311 (-),score=35.40 TRINITY_DN20678_c0_g1_i1:197-1129(-)
MACCFAFLRRKASSSSAPSSADCPPPKERLSNSGSLRHLPKPQLSISQVDQKDPSSSKPATGRLWSGLPSAFSKRCLLRIGLLRQEDLDSPDVHEKQGRIGDDSSSVISCSSTRSSCEHLRTGSSLSSPAQSCSGEVTLFRRWTIPGSSSVHDELRVEVGIAHTHEHGASKETVQQFESGLFSVVPYACSRKSYRCFPFSGHCNDAFNRDVCVYDNREKLSFEKTAKEGGGIVLDASRDQGSYRTTQTLDTPTRVEKFSHKRTPAVLVLHSYGHELESRLATETVQQSVPAQVIKLSHRRTRTAYVGNVR